MKKNNTHMSAKILCPLECTSMCKDHNPPDFIEKNSTFLLTLVASCSAMMGSLLVCLLRSRCRKISTPCLSCDREPVVLTDGDLPSTLSGPGETVGSPDDTS